MRLRHLLVLCCLSGGALAVQSCNDVDDLRDDAAALTLRVDALESSIARLNSSIEGLQYLTSGTTIVGVQQTDGGFNVEFSDGNACSLVKGQAVDALIPQVAIDENKYWSYSTDGGKTYTVMTDADGKPVKAYPTNQEGTSIKTPLMRISSEGYWQVSNDGGNNYENLLSNGEWVSALAGSGVNSLFSDIAYDETNEQLTVTLSADGSKLSFPVVNTFFLRILGTDSVQVFPLGEKRVYEVEQGDVQEALVQAPSGWQVSLTESELSITAPSKNAIEKEEKINIIITSPKNYIRTVTVNARLLTSSFGENACQTWKDFVLNNADNVLPDFSYAGYKHGETAPPDVYSLGYKVYDITDYGAVPNDGKSDRAAFIKLIEAMGAKKGSDSDADRYQMNKANAIIYFPEGEFILQGEEDGANKTIRLTMNNLILKGAGRDKTIIKMDKANEPKNESQIWSCPTMLELKHNSGLSALTTVSADAAKGTFAVEVASTSGITVGDWVCLYLKNTDKTLISQELSPYKSTSAMTDINNNGVQIYDYHQVKSISENTVTFVEPLMHGVESKWGWEVRKYPHYENIGVEDITFKGNAKSDFAHHASAADDGAYKLIDLVRLTNSWMRRVGFESVSECASITNGANVSVYDVHIGGNRGHSAIRSQASSRVFIGKVTDESNGYEAITSSGSIGTELIEGAGQYHACGVSKQSMGAVIWNVHWGKDACFEAHATQPRATLIDRCEGAFIPWRQGGDSAQMPNHLDDLVIWNMCATKVGYDAQWGSKFVWWDTNSAWWKLLPPTVVGFHGQAITFDESQMKKNESQGTVVEPYSLYEAQLRNRLGYVPAWINSLK